MEDILNQLITVGAGLGILAGAWLIWFISGIANNLFSEKRWSWKRMLEDVVKTLIMGVGILSWVILINVVDWYTQKLGMDISAVLDGANVVGLLAVIVGGSANYAAKAYRNFITFIGTDHIGRVIGGQNYTGIATDVKESLTAIYNSINSRQEDPESIAGEVLTKKETKQLAEMGAIPYYKLDVSTPQKAYQNLLGKGFNESWGWQCVAGFKEFMYSMFGQYVSAGGAAANYAYEPARSAVCKLGFTWHAGSEGLQDGYWGVWTNGLHGHVAMYYQGKWLGQNQGATDGSIGNVFNLMSLPMEGFAGYFRPNAYSKATVKPETDTTSGTVKIDDNSTESNQDFDIKKGDYVEVLRLVDVNGTRLRKQQDSPFLVTQINKTNRTAVLQSDDGDIYARMRWGDLKKIY